MMMREETIEIDSFPGTDLHVAAKNNEFFKVEQMLIFSADVNERDAEDKTPLHHAAMANEGKSHFEVIELLLNREADVNARDYEDHTPLWFLVNNCNVGMLRLFLNFKADFITSEPDLLFQAVRNSENPEVLQLLIDQGLDVNFENSREQTPLHETIFYYKNENHLRTIAEILLKNGADISTPDIENYSPLFYVIEKCQIETIKLFLKFDNDIGAADDQKNLFMVAIIDHNESAEVLQLLISSGFNVNYRNDLRKTPMHWACKSSLDNIEIIKCLLKNGADVDAVDYYGNTPLIRAMLSPYEINWKIAEKNLNFIMKHCDFNVGYNKYAVMFSVGALPEYKWKISVVKHLERLRALDIPLHKMILDAVKCNKELHDYYAQCKEELLQAKNTKIKNTWITYLDLLVDDRKKLKNYAGNDDFIEGFNNRDLQRFPIYDDVMDENIKKGIKRRELFDKSAIVLSDCLPIFNPNHLVIRNTLDCILSKKDLSKLCE